jgi:excisionase family DNA binding protein
MDEEVLTLQETAKLLRLYPRTVARLAIIKELPAFKVGTQWRFCKSDLAKWMADHKLQRSSNELGGRR